MVFVCFIFSIIFFPQLSLFGIIGRHDVSDVQFKYEGGKFPSVVRILIISGTKGLAAEATGTYIWNPGSKKKAILTTGHLPTLNPETIFCQTAAGSPLLKIRKVTRPVAIQALIKKLSLPSDAAIEEILTRLLGADFCVLHLNEEMPIRPLEIAEHNALSEGQTAEAWAIGYGLSRNCIINEGNNCWMTVKKDNERRAAALSVLRFGNQLLSSFTAPTENALPLEGFPFMGDSGGPILLNGFGAQKVMGVIRAVKIKTYRLDSKEIGITYGSAGFHIYIAGLHDLVMAAIDERAIQDVLLTTEEIRKQKAAILASKENLEKVLGRYRRLFARSHGGRAKAFFKQALEDYEKQVVIHSQLINAYDKFLK